MKLILSFIFSIAIYASAPSKDEIKFSSNVSPYLKDLVLELYLNSKISQEDIIKIGNDLLSPIDNDFIDLTILDAVLKTRTTKEYKHTKISQPLFNQLEKEVLKLDKNQMFSIRIAKKILKDLGELLTNRSLRDYNSYIKDTNQNKKASRDVIVFMNRISYLQFWIQTLKMPANKRKADLLNTNLEIFQAIKRNLEISSRSGDQKSKGKYISINDIDLIKARKAVDELFFNATPKKDSNYQAPKELPEPVESW